MCKKKLYAWLWCTEALYLKCEIRFIWIRSSGPRAGPIWTYCENVFNLIFFSILIINKKMHYDDVYEALHQNCEIDSSWISLDGANMAI